MGEDEESAEARARSTMWALRRAEIAVQALKEQRLRALGMAPAHYTLMIMLDSEPGLTGAELARRLNVTPQAVASLATRLEDRGQLERRPHPRHRHVQELHVTDAGRDALRAADPLIAAIEQRIVQELGPDDASRLTALLHRVADAVGSERLAGVSSAT